MADRFLWGVLCHAPLRALVLGQEVPVQPALLSGYAVHWDMAGHGPVIVAASDGRAEGVLATGLDDEALTRLAFWQAVAQAGQRQTVTVEVEGRLRRAEVCLSQEAAGAAWSFDAWLARDGAEVLAMARDILALRGSMAPETVARRRGPMAVRAGSRVRAGRSAPALRRLRAGPGDIEVAARRQPYASFFAVEEYDVAWRRFDSAMSATVTRAVFVSGDAVTVLPYDPVRDRVLVVEQFRAGPLARGDAQPWQIEGVAGRIDPGETPEEAARRESVEEAGLQIGALLPVASYYPSPGGLSEYIYSYVALTDLPDGAAGVFGVEAEAEDIRGHLMGFDALMALVNSGEIDNAPLILTALWLQRERGRLRQP